MSAELLDRIPDAQDIFGLLRRWSPVFLTGKDAGYKSAVADPERLSIVTAEGTEDVDSVALDLTDVTGRWHAALRCLLPVHGGFKASVHERDILERAHYGEDMTPEQIDTLARLVLRLAGRQA